MTAEMPSFAGAVAEALAANKRLIGRYGRSAFGNSKDSLSSDE
jgi:hypothetical protein